MGDGAIELLVVVGTDVDGAVELPVVVGRGIDDAVELVMEADVEDELEGMCLQLRGSGEARSV